MKPAPFEYVRAASVEDACAQLAADQGARLIAGGQTLVPLMAMRLARPTRLIDIARIPELSFIREENAAVVVGAATRQCTVEADALVKSRLPLLAKAMPYVGHAATRSRGTIGGSLANADPAAEIALVAVTLDAALIYQDGAARHEIPAAKFFLGPMVTALPSTACLVAVRFPVWIEARLGVGFDEINARRSDFAFASAAAQIALDEDGVCKRLVIGIGAATAFPLRLDTVAAALVGKRIEEGIVRAAVEEAVAGIDAMSDLQASAHYRRRAAVTLAVRAILAANHTALGRHAH
ncbi:MAG TPA: FAD binding domain-containing protein [Xanthobacteraceae bacterium]|nr:FAD binding domain-containing protein [Xanthobacteraceae bacterium]